MRFVVDTSGNGTMVIAASFVFVAYFLHPVVERALHRVRAYRAWKAIERKEMVEVTSYPFAAEVLYGRGKCDAARIIAVLLACFSVASWGLELSLDLATVREGPVDMMDRPPPVYVRDANENDGGEHWIVRNDFEVERVGDSGTLGNIDGSFEVGRAQSRYRIDEKDYEGSILTAWWSNDAKDAGSTLVYDVNNSGIATLTTLNCSRALKTGAVYIEGSVESWGNVVECETGPATLSKDTPPVILLEGSEEGAVYMVVEEDSNYPSFLYSVWKTSDGEVHQIDEGGVSVHHLFHIASRTRLVEAIITGIVLGVKTGGQCVDLLYQFSEANLFYPGVNLERASPFGEHPGNITAVTALSDVEPIEDGVNMDVTASTCSLWILLLSVLGIGWSICLRSRISMDIYNRDELIRAVSLPDQREQGAPLHAMRMFVHKNETGALSVVIEESDGKYGVLGWWDSCKRWSKCLRVWCRWVGPGDSKITESMQDPEALDSHGDGSPERPRQVVLEGWRLGASRQFPRSHGPWAVNLGASPISSLSSTPSGLSPAPRRVCKELDPTMAEFARNELSKNESVVSHTPHGSGSGFFTERYSNASVETITPRRRSGETPTRRTPASNSGRSGTTTTTTPKRSGRQIKRLTSIESVGSPASGRSGTTATPRQPGRQLRRLTSIESAGSPAIHSSATTTTPLSASRARFLMRSSRTLRAMSLGSPVRSWAEPDATSAAEGGGPLTAEGSEYDDPME